MDAAQKGAAEAGWALVANFPGTPPDRREDFEDLMDYLAAGNGFKTVEEKVAGNSAVVIIQDNPRPGKKIDIDPVYLIRQDSAWKLMPDFTDWELANYLAKHAVADFEALEQWYRKRKTEIYAELEK